MWVCGNQLIKRRKITGLAGRSLDWCCRLAAAASAAQESAAVMS